MKIKTATYVAAGMIAVAEFFGGPQWGKAVMIGTFIGLIYACGMLENYVNDLRQRVEVLENRTGL